MDSARRGEVDFSVDDAGVGVLVIDAPERRNALTPSLVGDISRVLDEVADDSAVAALVIASSGSAFCAGAALAQLDVADEGVLRSIYACFLKVRDLAIPTVAAVGGPAVGAGLNLALACDLRVTSAAAVFDARFLKIGLHPGGGASWLLRERVGDTVATAMLLFGQKIGGEEAVGRGLSWACVDDVGLRDAAIQLARDTAAAPRELTTLIKRTLSDTRTLTHSEAVELELERQVWTTTQPWYAQRRAETRKD